MLSEKNAHTIKFSCIDTFLVLTNHLNNNFRYVCHFIYDETFISFLGVVQTVYSKVCARTLVFKTPHMHRFAAHAHFTKLVTFHKLFDEGKTKNCFEQKFTKSEFNQLQNGLMTFSFALH